MFAAHCDIVAPCLRLSGIYRRNLWSRRVCALKLWPSCVCKHRNPTARETFYVAIYREKDFNERREAALEAKKALLQRFKAKPAADDPAVIARQQERSAILEARAIREKEKEKARQEKMAREAIERAERERVAEEARLAAEAIARAEAEAREAEERERIARTLADEAEKKAKRDARYAARKQRTGTRRTA